MYFGVYGEDEVDSIKLSGNQSILIRISASCSLNTINLYKKILNLDIYDIVGVEYLTEDFRMKLVDSFSKLNEFLLKTDFDEVIVHCAMGVSRSPAIMICIARMLGFEELEEMIKRNFRLYNKMIVDLFQEYPFIKKDVNIDEVIFKGHFINRNFNELSEFICIMDNDDKQSEGNLILCRKK